MSSLEGLHKEFAEEMGEIVIEIRQKLTSWKKRPTDEVLFHEILRGLHTVKGSAGLLEVWTLSELCHALEDCFAHLNDCKATLDLSSSFAEPEEGLSAIANYLECMFVAGKERPDLTPITEKLRGRFSSGKPTITRITAPVQGSEPASQEEDSNNSSGGATLSLDEAPDIAGIFSSPGAEGQDMVKTLLELLTREDQTERHTDNVDTRSPIISPLGFDPKKRPLDPLKRTANQKSSDKGRTANALPPSSKQVGTATPPAMEGQKEDSQRERMKNAPAWLQQAQNKHHAPTLLDDRPRQNPTAPDGVQNSSDPADLPEPSMPLKRRRRRGRLGPGTDLPVLGALPMGERWPQVLMNEWPSTNSDPVAMVGESTGSSLKVEVEKLDSLLDLVGTLLQEQKRQSELVGQLELTGPTELAHSFLSAHRRLGKQLNALRDAVIQTRMMPIRGVFRRYPNLVEDMARGLGREVSLSIRGEDSELDRTLIEGLFDPLVHLLRNAVGHGIEPPTERLRLGKARRGEISLSAVREGTMMMIEIKDDGRGIDPSAVANRAIQQGLISKEEVRALTDDGRLQLIFLPGMSSVRDITELAGRGMGMDAVRAQIARLGGRLEVLSRPNKGTTFRLMLPLTLALVQVLVAQVNQLSFAIPVSGIVDLSRGRKSLQRRGKGWLLNHTSGLLPAQSLACLLGLDSSGEPGDKSHVAVLGSAEKNFAIWVDSFDGIYECVVKPLTVQTTTLPGVTGGVSTGTGHTTLVLDPAVMASLIKGAS